MGEQFLQTEFMPITSLSTQIHHSKYVEVEPNSHRIVKTCVNLAEIPQIFHSLQKDVYTRKGKSVWLHQCSLKMYYGSNVYCFESWWTIISSAELRCGAPAKGSRSDLLRESGWWAHCKHKNTLMHFDALDQVQRLDCQKFKHFHFVISFFFKLSVQTS